MLVVFAMALLRRMPKPNLVIDFKPYLFVMGSLQSSTLTLWSIALAVYATFNMEPELFLAVVPQRVVNA